MKSEQTNDALLTTKDVAALLNTTPHSLRNTRARGLGPPALKLPGIGIRYRRADIEQWIRAHEKDAT